MDAISNLVRGQHAFHLYYFFQPGLDPINHATDTWYLGQYPTFGGDIFACPCCSCPAFSVPNLAPQLRQGQFTMVCFLSRLVSLCKTSSDFRTSLCSTLVSLYFTYNFLHAYYIQCFTSGQPGHKARNCPHVSRSS